MVTTELIRWLEERRPPVPVDYIEPAAEAIDAVNGGRRGEKIRLPGSRNGKRVTAGGLVRRLGLERFVWR